MAEAKWRGCQEEAQKAGHCARAASQALLKELLGKGLARRCHHFRKFISAFALEMANLC
jgi:hypothetical protein